MKQIFDCRFLNTANICPTRTSPLQSWTLSSKNSSTRPKALKEPEPGYDRKCGVVGHGKYNASVRL